MRTTLILAAFAVTMFGCAHRRPDVKAEGIPGTRLAGPMSALGGATTTGEPAIYFDIDTALLPEDAAPMLSVIAEQLKQNPRTKLRIEGHCDERGTSEYNLALGDSRARAAERYLVALGVRPTQILPVSYGEERPRESGHDEGTWSRNRRDDLVMVQ